MIGRNVYQAACGHANSANEYISDFKNRTNGLEENQRKAILDGILYEIFFDSEGQHRAKPKMEQFERAFALQDDAELASSFEFLRGCLAPFADRYFVLPGSGDGATVGIAVDPADPHGKLTVNAVWLDSVNILRQIPDEGQEYILGFRRSREFVFSEFREFVAEEMIIPKRLLTLEIQIPYTAGTKLVLPAGSFIGRSDQHIS